MDSGDSTAIVAAARAFSAAYMRGDAAAMAAMYTEDAAIFPEGTAAIEGRPAIERYWTLPAGRRVTNHVLTPDHIELHDGLALDYGRFTATSEVNGRASGPGFGKYVVVWRKGDDGRWRMQLDMWNRAPNPSGAPAAAPRDSATIAREIAALDSAWADAMVRGDTTYLKELFADELVVTSSNGNVRGKAGELDDVRPRPEFRTDWFRTSELSIRPYGNTAVVTGLARWQLTMASGSSENVRRYTAVYASRNNRWQMVALQLTRPSR
jgi:ketosteroid isomerase-like protein